VVPEIRGAIVAEGHDYGQKGDFAANMTWRSNRVSQCERI
jgi:hypothetical protein